MQRQTRRTDPRATLLTAPTINEFDKKHYLKGAEEFPRSRWWRQRIMPTYSKAAVDVFTGSSANLANASMSLGNSRLGQFFLHGVSDYTRTRPAGLALAASPGAESGILWSEEVETLTLPEYVILTSCGSARSTLRKGDPGANHLGGAILKTGSRAVALSPANLHTDATLEVNLYLHVVLLGALSSERSTRSP